MKNEGRGQETIILILIRNLTVPMDPGEREEAKRE
jgi:hypothetical protein